MRHGMATEFAIKTEDLGRLYKIRGGKKGQAKELVAGFDVLAQPQQVRPRINMVSGGESSGYGLLTVRENLWMFGQFYGLDHKASYKRIDELLAITGLSDRANT